MTSATITVKFTNPDAAAAANAHLSAEVDSRAAGLNSGRSSFIPGSIAYVLVYKSANVALVPAQTSAGSFSYGGTVSVQHTDELSFADVAAATLNVPADSIVSYKWLGRDLGAPVVGVDGKTVSVPTMGVGVLSITYNATATIGALASPMSVNGEVDFSILVLIKGEVAA
ncbi:MAG: hypothetical protein M0R47_19830 [Methylobacter sp.]|jgi:hypothetical protein|uniref:hypothetical protein n=1 Tax=Methylobacter sp. TaxID=2051955 RepID=UPI0025D9A77A|nr:hypothetical protein [Methylobacter sp.]MCK9622772.1 hypothetical protein [Methylobacter sp.]